MGGRERGGDGREGGREEGMGGREGERRGWEGMGGRERDTMLRSTCKHETSNDLVTRLLKMLFQEICKI